MQEFNNAESWWESIKTSTSIPEGFRFATTALEFIPRERPAGKPYPMRMSLIMAERPTSAFAGVFTRNAFPGAPVLLGREILAGDFAQAVLINNKVSNVGSPSGLADARSLCSEVARVFNIESQHVFAASTGIIGWSLPVAPMMGAIPSLADGLGNSTALDLSRSIMTTDSYPKAFSIKVGGGTILGVAKGAGMIEPNMATMLVFIMTDLDQPRDELQASLARVVNRTFNSISVDSDQSTSDMCLILSSQKKPRVSAPEFENALFELCSKLSGHIVRNGEGTAHVIRVRVSGLGDDTICRNAGKAIVNSPLVKTAIYGNDPNVGRLMASLGDFMGNSGLPLHAERLTVSLCGHRVFERGAFHLSAETEIALSAALTHARQDPTVQGYPQHERFVDIELNLLPDNGLPLEGCSFDVIHPGCGHAEVLGSDLGYEYVKENADYRS